MTHGLTALLQFSRGSDAFSAVMQDKEREEASGVEGSAISRLFFPALDTDARFRGSMILLVYNTKFWVVNNT